MKKQTFSIGKPMLLCNQNLCLSKFKLTLLFVVIFLPLQHIKSQVTQSSQLFQTIKKMDSLLFENGFNQCKLSTIESFISKDLEFYHDQSGVSKTRAQFITEMKKNICLDTKNKFLRKLVDNSLEVYPLYENGTLYGAIQNGYHEFYTILSNKTPQKTGIAKFSHVWIKENNNWVLKRILSYNHKAVKLPVKKSLILSDKELDLFVGQYKAPNTGDISIIKKEMGLEIKAGEMVLVVFPETKTLFFNKQAPLSFEFIKNTNGNTIKMLIREHGNIVEEAKKI
ncbi:DUF4440 domain-containing protein [Aquimarina algiphila]|uniref:DUF4440 domain-containing protein n=1 Tax=Aquimarina algiphila TaxID=2047982 RepID=UPI00232D942C|nr:DUF4440 domain-containing protein [Aquimarina algiphila]